MYIYVCFCTVIPQVKVWCKLLLMTTQRHGKTFLLTGPLWGESTGHYFCWNSLTHWGRVTHICVSKLTIIGPDNGLSPGRRQAIIWTNAGILLIGPLGTNFSENLIGIQTFSFKKMPFENVVCEMSSILSRPQCVKYVHLILFYTVIIHSITHSTDYNDSSINVIYIHLDHYKIKQNSAEYFLIDK